MKEKRNQMSRKKSVKRHRNASSANSGKTVEVKKRGRTENLRPWRPGESGNLSGRPKKTLLTEATRAWLEEIDSKSGLTNAERVVVALGKKALKGSHEAFRIIGERAEGKPLQAVEHTEDHSDVRSLIEAMNQRWRDGQAAKKKEGNGAP
jgi:hypothetical protein